MAELRTSGLSPEAVRALDLATVIARNSSHPLLTPDHLATALLKQSDGLAGKLLRVSLGADLFELRTRLESGLRDLHTALVPGALTHRFGGESFGVAPEVVSIVDRARRLAVQQQKPVAGTDHLLAALLEEEFPARKTLESAGIDAGRVQAASAGVPLPPALASRHATATGDAESSSSGAGARRGGPVPAVTDLVQAARDGRRPRVAERVALLEQIAHVLVEPRTSAVLLGENGTGRRSLIQALAQVLARTTVPGIPQAVYAVAPAALLDGPELVIRQALERAQGAILALPDLHQFFGASSLGGFVEAGVALKQALLQDRVRLIGTSAPPLYTRFLESDPVLRDHLRPLTVPPASDSETRDVLNALKPQLEQDNGVTISDPALTTALALSRQYLTTPQPGAAVGLLQRACAVVRLSHSALFSSPDVTGPAGAAPAHDQGRAAQVAPDSTVDDSDVAQALHQQTGIPIGQIAGHEQDRLARMEDILHQRVVGQDAAISALSRAVRRARAGLKDPKRPIGSFLFLGPSGVGKTESALALAEFLFGAEDAVVTLNMSEYMEKHNAARLIGAPPGYVGYEEGGQLTERVRQKPYAVVLLDEVEKAHSDVYDLFLQVLDQGQLQDSRGRVVSFRNTVVIMTSNLGGRALTYPEHLPEDLTPREAVMQAVRDHFRPEFLNRLDGIIVFDPLDRAALGKILELMLAKTARQLASQGITLELTDPAKQWLLDQHQEPEYGARPLTRIVQTHVKDEIAERLIGGTLVPGQRVLIGLKNGKLDFRSK
jgi:ATP-dependent Clp protease ATP-binding subunit ClpC